MTENFKSYDELKARLDKVLGVDGAPIAAKTTVEQARAMPRKPAPAMEDASVVDDDLAYFTSLAND